MEKNRFFFKTIIDFWKKNEINIPINYVDQSQHANHYTTLRHHLIENVFVTE